MLVSGGHSSLLLVERRDRVGRAARRRPSTTPRGRPSTRSRACSACRSPAARTSTRRRAGRGRDRLPARPHGAARHRAAPLRLLLLRAQDRRRPWVEARARAGEPVPVADVAASFQEAVCDVLTRKAVDAANSWCRPPGHRWRGRGELPPTGVRRGARRQSTGIRVRVPRPKLCTDNGAMVAALGAELVEPRRQPRPPSTCPRTRPCR